MIHSSARVANHTQQVTTFEWTRTLAAICRTCKQLNNVATPLLYQAFVKPKSTLRWRDKPSQRVGNLRPFLRTIVERPDLAKLVKIVYLGPWEMHDFRAIHTIPDRRLRDMFTQSIVNINIGPEQDKWVDDLLSSQEDAEVALLLCLLTDVVDLSIKLAPCSERRESKRNFYFCEVFKEALTSSPRVHNFKELKHISLHSHDMLDDECVEFAYPSLSRIMCLPSLEAFHGHGVLDYWTDHETYPVYSSIHSIKLRECSVTIPAIRKLVASCTKLDTFDLDYNDRDQMDMITGNHQMIPKEIAQTSPITWQGILDTLHPQKDHLKVLRIEADACIPLQGLKWYEEDVFTEEVAHNIIMRSLPDFTTLRDISIPHMALLGPDDWTLEKGKAISFPRPAQADLVDLLPSSLESLTITDSTCALLPQLEILLDSYPAKLPSLRRIQVEPVSLGQMGDMVTKDGETDDENRLNRLRDAFNAAGITWVNYEDPLHIRLPHLEEDELDTDISDLDDEQNEPNYTDSSLSGYENFSESDGWRDEDDTDSGSESGLMRSNPVRMLASANRMAGNRDLDADWEDHYDDDDDEEFDEGEFLSHNPALRFLAAVGRDNEHEAAIDAWVDGWRPGDDF